jgi:protein TonB
VDQAVVTMRVVIAADGTPQAVDVVRDPGHGFGQAARGCAYRKHWDPALNRDGRPVAGTILLNVRFDR